MPLFLTAVQSPIREKGYHQKDRSIFFPGYEIIQAVQNGREHTLPSRLQETLEVARKMVSGVTGSQASMEREIHDLMCDHIKYKIDDSSNEDDCCIGAILNGRANCDGYSDAFFLLCGLKNIPVKLMTGGVIKGLSPGEDPTHMWNLVLLGGSWRGVDVTADDPDSSYEIGYSHFNMGMDRMKENYSFVEDFLPDNVLRETILHEQPVPEYRLSTVEELIGILRSASNGGTPKVILWMKNMVYKREWYNC